MFDPDAAFREAATITARVAGIAGKLIVLN
jgi:hypothetical protein